MIHVYVFPEEFKMQCEWVINTDRKLDLPKKISSVRVRPVKETRKSLNFVVAFVSICDSAVAAQCNKISKLVKIIFSYNCKEFT